MFVRFDRNSGSPYASEPGGWGSLFKFKPTRLLCFYRLHFRAERVSGQAQTRSVALKNQFCGAAADDAKIRCRSTTSGQMV